MSSKELCVSSTRDKQWGKLVLNASTFFSVHTFPEMQFIGHLYMTLALTQIMRTWKEISTFKSEIHLILSEKHLFAMKASVRFLCVFSVGPHWSGVILASSSSSWFICSRLRFNKVSQNQELRKYPHATMFSNPKRQYRYCGRLVMCIASYEAYCFYW